MSKNKDRNPSTYYANKEVDDARMHRLVALKLRNIQLTTAYYNKGRKDDDSGEWGLFDICDPSEDADSLIEELRFFGFLPKKEPAHD